jgi:hypothetical protein
MKGKPHLRTPAARQGLLLLQRIQDQFRQIKDRVPIHREIEFEACLEQIESLSDAILDDQDLPDELVLQRLALPELFIASLSRPEEATGWEEE